MAFGCHNERTWHNVKFNNGVLLEKYVKNKDRICDKYKFT